MSWNATRERPLHLLYDGECRFCVAGSARLVRFARPGLLTLISTRDEAGLARFSASTREALKSALQLVSPDGEVASGAEAVARALNTRPVWKLVTWVYWVPVLRQLFDWAYALVAKHRYKIAGRLSPCDSGACEIPPGPRPR